MSEDHSTSLVNLGNFSKPADTLIKKISDAIGGIARPRQIRRVAQAEADAEIIKAEARISISEMERRALARMVHEEGKKQENIESITEKAIPHLSEEAKPENIEDDWISNFFDRCRLTSDKEMQELWAKILSGEANAPGTYSKRTIDIVSTLGKKDAMLFTNLATFCWTMGDIAPVILDIDQGIYNAAGINFNSLGHLEDIGLLKFDNIAGYIRKISGKSATIGYYGKPLTLEPPIGRNHINLGKVLLTQAGKELAVICGSKPSNEFYEYVLSQWQASGYVLSTPIIKKSA